MVFGLAMADRGGLFAGMGVALRFAAVSTVYGLGAARHWQTRRNLAVAAGLGYCSLVHAVVTLMVAKDCAPWIIGKTKDGRIPGWSYAVWGPFHATNRVFAHIAKKRKSGGVDVGVATEVYPGWWLGGWHSWELGHKYSAVVDLCCELPERCEAKQYMCCANWDGILHQEDIAAAAPFLAEASKDGPVLVHCAHGVGRSTATIVAALVEAGHFETTDAAFAHCKKLRPVVRQSSRLRAPLLKWEAARRKTN